MKKERGREARRTNRQLVFRISRFELQISPADKCHPLKLESPWVCCKYESPSRFHVKSTVGRSNCSWRVMRCYFSLCAFTAFLFCFVSFFRRGRANPLLCQFDSLCWSCYKLRLCIVFLHQYHSVRTKPVVRFVANAQHRQSLSLPPPPLSPPTQL